MKETKLRGSIILNLGLVFVPKCQVRIPVFYENLIDFLPKLNSTIHGALLNGENLENVDPNEIKILVMGNEGKGISPSLQKHINQAVTIPGYGQAESLNVSIATGIFLHHWSQLKS